jgi:hypothetical protein
MEKEALCYLILIGIHCMATFKSTVVRLLHGEPTVNQAHPHSLYHLSVLSFRHEGQPRIPATMEYTTPRTNDILQRE